MCNIDVFDVKWTDWFRTEDNLHTIGVRYHLLVIDHN